MYIIILKILHFLKLKKGKLARLVHYNHVANYRQDGGAEKIGGGRGSIEGSRENICSRGHRALLGWKAKHPRVRCKNPGFPRGGGGCARSTAQA